MLRYTMVRTMKINACRVITRIWNTAQGQAPTNCQVPIMAASRINTNSPAYMLPNSRRPRDTGFKRMQCQSSDKSAHTFGFDGEEDDQEHYAK